MYSKHTPGPIDYVASKSWEHLQIPASLSLSQLEKAAVGYIAASSAQKGNRTYRMAAPHSKLQWMIFEYLKIYEPDTIRELLEENLELVERINTNGLILSYRRTIDNLAVTFTSMSASKAAEIAYEQFEPAEFGPMLASGGQTPFKKYCGRIVGQLVERGVLARYKALGRKYIAVNPRLKIQAKAA